MLNLDTVPARRTFELDELVIGAVGGEGGGCGGGADRLRTSSRLAKLDVSCGEWGVSVGGW